MPFCVRNVSNEFSHCPQSLAELVSFINQICQSKDEIFVQISNYEVEVVQQLSELIGTNFFDWDQTQAVGLNPFTPIYISKDGTVEKHSMNYRSKIIIYGKRPIHNN